MRFSPDSGTLRSPRLMLAVILLLALALRLSSIHFGLPAMLDPDEPVFELGAFRMITGGQLNPEWFGHPATTTMYLLALIDVAVLGLGLATGRFDGVSGFTAAIYRDPGILLLPHRVAIALIAVIGIVLIYRLAARLFDKPTGLVTAAILAVSPVHITYSQLVRSDMMATVFATGVFLCALFYARDGGRKAFLGTVVMVALAITTKWPFAVTFLALVGAVMLRWHAGQVSGREAAMRLVGGLVLVILAMVVISPFLVIEFHMAAANLQGEKQAHHLGANGTTFLGNAWWYLTTPMFRAFGIAGMAFAAGGLALVAGAFGRARANREVVAICLPPAIAILLISSSQAIVWERWIMLMVPIAAMLVAHALVQSWRLIGNKSGPLPGRMVAAVGLSVVLAPLAFAARADGIERVNDTRMAASRWIMAHAAPGSTILVEHFAFDLASRDEWTLIFPMGEAGCTDVRNLLNGRVDNHRVNASRGGRSNLDYGTLPPAMADACTADYAVLTQYLRYEAEKDIYPQEYANYLRLLARGEVVAEFRPERGVSGGRITVIVRFAPTSATPAR
jgi:hypothetical protein